MSLVIAVEIDPSKAGPEIKKLEADLGSLKNSAKSVGDALTMDDKGRLRDAGNRFVTTAANAGEATTSVKGLSETLSELGRQTSASQAITEINHALERQIAMLDRIRAPELQFAQGLEALDSLLSKGKISTEEYAREVANLNRAIERANPSLTEFDRKKANTAQATNTISLPSPSGGGGGNALGEVTTSVQTLQGASKNLVQTITGDIGGALSGLMSGGAAAAGAIAALAITIISLADNYNHLYNSVLKFTDASHDAADIISDQLSLSRELDSSLGDTLEFYDAIRDGTDDLNLSYAEQIKLTKEIGQAVVLSGKGLGESGGLMATLSYAFASGTINGRELKGVMKSMPDIAALLTEQLGKSRKELIVMADKGQVTGEMLRKAFDGAAESLDEKFANRAISLSTTWTQFKDTLTVSIGAIAKGSGLTDILSTAIKGLGQIVRGITLIFEAFGEALDVINEKLGSTSEATGKSYSFFDTFAGLDKIKDLSAMMEQQTAELNKQKAALDATIPSWQAIANFEKANNEVIRLSNVLAAEHNEILERRKKLSGDFSTSLQDQVVNLKALEAMYREAAAQEAAGFKPGHFTDAKGNQRNQNAASLYAQYQDAQRALTKTQDPAMGGVLDIRNTVEDATTGIESIREKLRAQTITQREANAEIRKYREEIRNAYGDGGTDYIKQMLEEINGPMRDFRGQLAAVNYLLAEKAITAEQAARSIKKLENSFSGGFSKLLEDATNPLKGGGKPMTQKQEGDLYWANLERQADRAVAAEKAAAKKMLSEVGAFNKALADRQKDAKQGEGDFDTARAKAYSATFDRIKQPIADYRQAMSIVNELQSNNAITAEEYAREVAGIASAYEAATGVIVNSSSMWEDFQNGAVSAAREIEATLIHTADATRGAFVATFNDLNNVLTDLIVDQKADWGAFLDGLARRWTNLALQQAEGAILRAAGAGETLTGGASAAANAKAAASSGLLGTAASSAAATTAQLAASAGAGALALQTFTASVAAAAVAAQTAAAASAVQAGAQSASTAAAVGSTVADVVSSARVAPTGPPAWRPGNVGATEGVTSGSASSARNAPGGSPDINFRVINNFDGKKATLDTMDSREGQRSTVNNVNRFQRRRKPFG